MSVQRKPVAFGDMRNWMKALKAAGYTVAASYAGNDAAAEKFKAETGISVYKFDVGDFAALRQIHGEDLVVQGSSELVQAIDTTGLVIAKDRPIAVLGMSDVVVVDTGDAVLVTTMEHAQRVKEVVVEMAATGQTAAQAEDDAEPDVFTPRTLEPRRTSVAARMALTMRDT